MQSSHAKESISPRRWAGALLTIAFCLGGSAVVSAESGQPDAVDPSNDSEFDRSAKSRRGRLTLSAGLGFAAIGQRSKTSVGAETTIFRSPGRGAPPVAQFDPFGRRVEKDLLKGSIALSAQLAGPQLELVPGTPRLVFESGVYIPLDGRITTASAEGIGPTQVRDPILFADLRFRSRWFVGVGLEFSLPQDGWRFVVRPSIDYVGQKLKVGVVLDEEIRPVGSSSQQSVRTASDDLTHHGIGSRLTLEAEMGSWDHWVPTLFVEVRAAYLYGDFNSVLEIPGTNWNASTNIKLRRLAGSGAAGFRLKWRGF